MCLAAFARYVPEATVRGQGRAGLSRLLCWRWGWARVVVPEGLVGVGVAGLRVGPVQAPGMEFIFVAAWLRGWLDGWTA